MSPSSRAERRSGSGFHSTEAEEQRRPQCQTEEHERLECQAEEQQHLEWQAEQHYRFQCQVEEHRCSLRMPGDVLETEAEADSKGEERQLFEARAECQLHSGAKRKEVAAVLYLGVL